MTQMHVRPQTPPPPMPVVPDHETAVRHLMRGSTMSRDEAEASVSLLERVLSQQENRR